MKNLFYACLLALILPGSAFAASPPSTEQNLSGPMLSFPPGKYKGTGQITYQNGRTDPLALEISTEPDGKSVDLLVEIMPRKQNGPVGVPATLTLKFAPDGTCTEDRPAEGESVFTGTCQDGDVNVKLPEVGYAIELKWTENTLSYRYQTSTFLATGTLSKQ